ncbi:MAG: alpha/beta hydrolase [Clostridia bacterium]|nr:alpha/beta hydrolase [Clostridia bacterium]
MIKETITVNSEFDGLPLQVIVALPEGEAKGVVQLSHGMCEYIDRYEQLMRVLTENGYIVAGNDHRGHGNSVKTQDDLGYFYEKTGKAIVSDLVTVTKYLKNRFPALPVCLFGHSMGSMAARCYLQENDTLVDKAVICGSPSKNPLAGVAIFLADTIALFKGERHRSKLLADLAVGNGDKRFPNDGKNAWLSKNKESIEKYNADPWCNYVFTCNGFRNLFCLLKNTYTQKLYRVQNPALPIYFIAGADDPVIVSKEKWEEAKSFMTSLGYQKVSGVLYEGLRHEVFNELDSEAVYADLLDFLSNA